MSKTSRVDSVSEAVQVNNNVRDQLNEMDDSKRAAALKTISKVDQMIETANSNTFSEKAFARENSLRTWIRKITDNHLMNVSDAEKLISKAAEMENNSMFAFEGISFIKTSSGLLDRTANYIGVLENTVIDLTDQKVPKTGFFHNLKLAFKCLLKGEL